MDKELLSKLIDNKLSIRDISKRTGKSFTTIRYWIKKLDLVEFVKSKKNNISSEIKNCPCCKLTKSRNDFYKRRAKDGGSVYCKSCTNEKTIIRLRDFKNKCVDYKGGSCIICNYNKCMGALEFHHLDPTKKDFSISHLKRFTFNQIVTSELDKCILVCSNCHREIHAGLVVPLGIEPRISH